LPNLLGISVNNGGSLPEYFFHIVSRIYQVHPWTFFLGLLSICVIVFFQRWRPNWPGTLLAMVLAGFIVTIFHLEDRHVEVVGAVRGGLPPLHFPDLSIWGQAGKLAPGALAIAILGLMEAISISQTIADQTRQRLNLNRELIGQGLANVGASIFGGYPCSGSFTRSAVNFRSGAKTPLSGIISGLAVLAIVLIAGPMASKLPLSALSAVLIVVSYQLIQPKGILRTLKATRADAAVMVVTFLVTVLLNIEFSIYVGVLLSIGLHLANTSHPQIYSMIPEPGTDKMKGSSHGMICCQMDIVQIEGSIYFGSSTFVRKDLRSRMRHHSNLTNLLIRMNKVNTLDASGIHTFETILQDIRSRGGDFYFSGVNHRVFDVLNNSGLLSELGHGHSHTTTSDAIRTAMRDSFCPAICAACNEAVFRECPDLKQGNWEIFGAGVRPRLCRISGDDKTKKTDSGLLPGARQET
jgi:SulP family sulfate permease